MLILAIENVYGCGRISNTVAKVVSPPVGIDATGQDSEWFYTEIYNATGDGHPCGSSDDAVYTVAVVASDDRPDLIGTKWEI